MTALLELGAEVPAIDAGAAEQARAKRTGRGRLSELAGWLAGTQGHNPPTSPTRVRCLATAALDDEVAELAARGDLGVRLLDPSADPIAALAAAKALVNDEVESGVELIVLAAGTGDGLAACTAIALFTGAEPVALLPRGAAAIDTDSWVRQATRLRDARRMTTALRNRPDELLTALDSTALASSVGVVLQSAARRTPLVLDGVTALAAALFCFDLQTRTADWWQIADTADDVVHRRAVEALDRRPLLDLGAGTGTGAAGLLALAVLRAAAART